MAIDEGLRCSDEWRILEERLARQAETILALRDGLAEVCSLYEGAMEANAVITALALEAVSGADDADDP
jgi:hypothetical protein|tara:strand:+ start:1397 stop:1603 length:207 start_codon:yes stop_codon:yes gene_type:complete